jgi:hypothetical protein
MPKAYASTVIDAPADKVWAAARDFNALKIWNPGLVARSEIEDNKTADQVGCVRDFYLQDGAHIRERLLHLSDAERSYSYNFETTPFPVQNYHATLRVTPVTDGDRSFVEWWATFDCEPARTAEWIDTFGNAVFASGLQALRRHLGA